MKYALALALSSLSLIGLAACSSGSGQLVPGSAASTATLSQGTSKHPSIYVGSAVTVSESFSPTQFAGGGTSKLTITLSNTNTIFSKPEYLDNLSLSDTLPSALNLVPGTTPTTTCGGTVGTNGVLYGPTIALSNGTLPAYAVCTITVSVTGHTPGTYVNTIPAGAVGSLNLIAQSNAASASVTITQAPIHAIIPLL